VVASPFLGVLVFLTPLAALVAVAFLVPLVALAVRERAGSRVRSNLGLPHPRPGRTLGRLVGLAALAALVAATAAQPVTRGVDRTRVRADAELYLTFDVTRSMLATDVPGGTVRFERARRIGVQLHRALRDVPTGVATLTNRMMPLLFPTGDERGVDAVLAHSLRIMQPQPAFLTAARASQLGALTLAADRSYFNPEARKRVLVVLSDLDSDFFSLDGTLKLLRRHRIEPFLIRVAEPSERIFDRRGQPEAYTSVSTVSVDSLRSAGWHAYEESEPARAIADVRSYLGAGGTRPSGVVESQRNLAPLLALAALVLAVALTVPGLHAGLTARSA
jgi:hypothetical protein